MTLPLVIGVGNVFRGDDGAGRIAAQWLRQHTDAEVTEASGEGLALLEMWKGSRWVVMIDAVSSGAAPGTIHRFDAGDGPLPASFFSHSTHAYGPAQAIELARTLHRLPEKLVVYGIEGFNFRSGRGLGPAVEEAVNELVKRILQEITDGDEAESG